MELQEIKITNYKSLVDLEIKNPNPFTVFAGPNGAGKSNIFEALEFASYFLRFKRKEAEGMFGGLDKIVSFNNDKKSYKIDIFFQNYGRTIEDIGNDEDAEDNSEGYVNDGELLFEMLTFDTKFFYDSTRVFINKNEVKRIQYSSDRKLLPDASNTASVLKTILLNPIKKEEFVDWVKLFVPGLSTIEVRTDNIQGTDSLLIFEKGTNKPFTKSLISDGTYNILALLTAVYQADQPQFLCIEEPENGLNPFVVESLVSFFRQQCEEKGHYIWLNTHSQTLVKHLQPQELILVDKKDGATTIKQFPADYNLHGLEMDEAWLSNALGGGIPW